MSLIPVGEALDRLFALVTPVGTERVPLVEAGGRVLREPLAARRTQPPTAVSAMDGYALPDAGAAPGNSFRIVGESAAGHGFSGALSAGEAVRIFTGAPLPEGAVRVVLQEDVAREGEAITLGPDVGESTHVRPAGGDFRAGDPLGAPRLLSPADVALIAAMNHAEVPVARRPDVVILATGDELVPPGTEPGPDQIVASNSYGLHALLAAAGARPHLLPIAEDNLDSLAFGFGLAEGADLILTIGGASVGDHDLVGAAAGAQGLERSFWKVAMRPGKPLMAGRMAGAMMIGLPGNPVSAMVCGSIFVLPVIRAMLGLPATPAPRETVRLAESLAPNGPREHYLRGGLGPDGVRAFDKQDSSLLRLLSEADCLVVQPAGDPGRPAGADVEIIRL